MSTWKQLLGNKFDCDYCPNFLLRNMLVLLSLFDKLYEDEKIILDFLDIFFMIYYNNIYFHSP